MILKIHKDITNGLLEETFFEGSYRNTNNSIQNRRTGKVRYTPPKHENVPKLMKDLIEWINTDSNSLHSVVAAGMVHYELVRIHPFVNGNGRTARALASLILCLRSFDIKKYFALDEHYNLDKKVYVDALKSADESGDLTRWLEYFTEGVLISVHKVFKMISELPTMVNNPVELTEDQIKVVNYVHQNERITRKETGELLNLSDYKSTKILKELKDMEILKSEGKGYGTYYVFDI